MKPLKQTHREVQHTHHGRVLQFSGTLGNVCTTWLEHRKADNATWNLLSVIPA